MSLFFQKFQDIIADFDDNSNFLKTFADSNEALPKQSPDCKASDFNVKAEHLKGN